jgi:hypothetical protein
MALELKCQDDPDFRRALDKDDKELNKLLRNTLNSDDERKAVLQLNRDDGERFLALAYSVRNLDSLSMSWAE